MGGLLAGISGADSAGSNAQGYATQAGGQSAAAYQAALANAEKYYNTAEGQIAGSATNPAAKSYIQSIQAQYAPEFQKQNEALNTQEAANGTSSSGAAKNDMQTLAGQQSGTLANAIAPLYQGIMSAYDSTVAGSAGAQAGIAGSGASAQTGIYGQGAQSAQNAYNNQLGQFEGALGEGAAAAGY